MPIAHPHPAKVRQAREPAAIVEVNAWGLPDHLKHLAHLLPTLSPAPLELPASAETMDADDPPPQLEPPTRVRFPTKRITMPEMKKRAKHVLEYMAKLQVDMSEKERRSENTLAADLGSKDSPSTLSSSPALDFGLISATLDQPLGDDGADASVSVLDGICAGSLKMMDNLTKVSSIIMRFSSLTLPCALRWMSQCDEAYADFLDANLHTLVLSGGHRLPTTLLLGLILPCPFHPFSLLV